MIDPQRQTKNEARTERGRFEATKRRTEPAERASPTPGASDDPRCEARWQRRRFITGNMPSIADAISPIGTAIAMIRMPSSGCMAKDRSRGCFKSRQGDSSSPLDSVSGEVADRVPANWIAFRLPVPSHVGL
jgi:hypothetical protein